MNWTRRLDERVLPETKGPIRRSDETALGFVTRLYADAYRHSTDVLALRGFVGMTAVPIGVLGALSGLVLGILRDRPLQDLWAGFVIGFLVGMASGLAAILIRATRRFW
jgi:hypothetical protein